MKILEILLPKNIKDRDISPKHTNKIDMLQKRMNAYVDKISDPSTSPKGREFLKAKLRDDYIELKDVFKSVAESKFGISEAVNRLPLTNADFELVKELMENPIPAIIAPIYIQEIIDDDEFNEMLREFEETSPNLDVRPHIVEWFKRVMPDQMHRFYGGQTTKQREGIMSPIHGYDPHMYHGSSESITPNGATGRR